MNRRRRTPEASTGVLSPHPCAMPTYQTTIDIAAPCERVWRVLSDLERWHEWTASITRIEALDPPSFAVGSRFRVIQPKLRPAVWAITELRPGASFTWLSQSMGMKVVAVHAIQPAGEGACQATLSTTFSGPVGLIVARFARALTQEYIGLEAAGLKRRSEEQE